MTDPSKSIHPSALATLRCLLDTLKDDIDDTLAWAVFGDWCIDYCPPEWWTWNREQLDTKMGKAFALVNVAPLATTTWKGKSQCEAVSLHTDGYAEPGYKDPECGVIATGNWNEITDWTMGGERKVIDSTPHLLEQLLSLLDVPCEWSDEWSDCSECGKLVRTEPNRWDWQPSYHLGEGELLCAICYHESLPEPEEEQPEDDPPHGCILCGNEQLAPDENICHDCLDRNDGTD